MPRILFLVVSLATLCLASSAMADTLRVPRDHDTIQAAVEAAANGDRILVTGGTWREHVVIDAKTDIELIGKKKPVIDGEGTGTALTITSSNGVTVRGFVIDGGAPYCVLIEDGSTNVRISRCTVRNAADRGIRVFESDEVIVDKNRVEDVFDHCVELRDADDCLVRSNRLERSEEGDGVAINDGTRNEVTRNSVAECGDHGIAMDGPGNVATKNRIRNLGLSGVISRANGNTVEKNRISGAADYGIALFSATNSAARNGVKGAGKDGVRIEGGSGNRLERCKVSGSTGDGIRVVGAGNEITKCKSTKNGGADIRDSEPEGANTYSGNKAKTIVYSSP